MFILTNIQLHIEKSDILLYNKQVQKNNTVRRALLSIDRFMRSGIRKLRCKSATTAITVTGNILKPECLSFCELQKLLGQKKERRYYHSDTVLPSKAIAVCFLRSSLKGVFCFMLFVQILRKEVFKMKTKLLALIMCALLLFSLAACDASETETPDATDAVTADTTEDSETTPEGIWADATYTEDKTFGDGAKKVKVEVKAEEYSVTFTILTDAETLGDALLAHSLVEGEAGAYGLYIKKVNGMLADYDTDQTYWLLTKNGEYVMSGVDTTKITDGEHYELTRTK